MVDPLSAALTGITLVTTVADKIKQGINAYNSVAELGSQLEALFEGEKQLQRARNKKAGKGDPFSTQGVAREVVEHKLAQEKLQEVAVAIDMRFGHGTWAGIIAERNKRIRDAKEAHRKAQIERQRKINEMVETAKVLGVVTGAVVLFLGIIVGYTLWI